MTRLSLFFATISLGALAGACNDGTGLGANRLQVGASLSSVALADDCSSSSGLGASPCAADAPSCQGFCQQSSMQLDISAANGDGAVAFSVERVRLLDEQSGDELDTLTARDPRLWQDAAYVVWDERIHPTAQLKATYKLSAPSWSKLNGSDRFGGPSKTYRVEVEVRIDGVVRTLVLDGVAQEPPVST